MTPQPHSGFGRATGLGMPRAARPYIETHPEMRPLLEEIQRGIARRGRLRGEEIQQKELADALRLDQGEVSRKLKGETRWNVHEIVSLARYLAAPPGWPLLSWAAMAPERPHHPSGGR